jgi:hypothetical protein
MGEAREQIWAQLLLLVVVEGKWVLCICYWYITYIRTLTSN